jgi:hypothetical protein
MENDMTTMTIRVPANLKATLEEQAKSEDLTVSQLVRRLMANRLSEHPSEPCPNACYSPAPQSPTHSFPPVGSPEWKAEMQALAKANQSKAS